MALSPISVIIPVHNRADLAGRCLAALARWTTPLEIIVVDDGSSDPAVDLLSRSGLAHHWLRNPEALGFSAAVNRGLTRATGDPLLLLNSDAEVTENGDHRLRQSLAPAPGSQSPAAAPALSAATSGGVPIARTGAVAARLVFPDGRPQWSGGAFPSLAWLFTLASGLGRGARLRLGRRPPSGFTGGSVDWAPGAALAIARPAWEAVGPFDESYRHYAQDLDYCQRLASAGWGVSIVPDWTVVHHFGGSVGHLGERDAPEKRMESPRGSSYDGQQLDLLWLDLLRWARLHRSARWARQARISLLLGGRLRQARLALHRDTAEAQAVAAAVAAVSALTALAPAAAQRGG